MRIIKSLVASIVVAVVPVLAAPPAGALSNAPDRGTWGFNGRVNAILRSGGTVYVGGAFTQLISPAGAMQAADHLAAFDAVTLQPRAWRPSVDGPVYALAASGDGSTIYVGGDFTSVDDASRASFAAVSRSGSLLPLKSNANGSVRAFVVSGSTLYMGGAFRKVQREGRLGLAAIGATNGALLPWSPSVTIPGTTTVPIVRGLALANGDIVAVGKFSSANGPGEAPQPEPNQARFDAATGAREPWADNYAFLSYGVVSDGADYYVAAGGPGGSVLRFGPAGDQTWKVHTDGDVQAIGLYKGSVIAGGHFLQSSGRDLPRLASISRAGDVDPSWRPNPNGTDSGVWAITGTTGPLYVGGGFTAVGGDGSFQRFAQFGGGSTPPGEEPATVRVVAVADAMVKEGSPGTNYGGNQSLRVDAGTDPDVESYLKFTVNGLSGGPVEDATLRLWTTSGTINGPAAYATTNDWTEAGTDSITWSTRPARTSSPSDDKGAVSAGTWVEFDVTSLVSGNGTFSFVLAGTSTDGLDMSSKEGTTSPELVVTG